MPEEVSKAPRNHHNKGLHRGPEGPKAKKTKRNVLKKEIGMPYAAITTGRQLRILEEDTMPQEGTECLSKTPLIITNSKGKSQSKEVDKPTSEATLDKDAKDHKMTDWEYLM